MKLLADLLGIAALMYGAWWFCREIGLWVVAARDTGERPSFDPYDDPDGFYSVDALYVAAADADAAVDRMADGEITVYLAAGTITFENAATADRFIDQLVDALPIPMEVAR